MHRLEVAGDVHRMMSGGVVGEGTEGGCGTLTRSRVSTEQLELLLSFMEEHPDFAAGKQSIYSRFSSSKLWRLLSERLNAAAADSGGALKSPDKWCRVSTVTLHITLINAHDTGHWLHKHMSKVILSESIVCRFCHDTSLSISYGTVTF